jgi:hypothetical protein
MTGKDDRGVDVGVAVDADIVREDGVAHDGARDDASGGDDGVDAHAGAAGFAEDELGGRVLVGARAHGPRLVVEVEDRGDGGDIEVGLVVGLECADVAPVEGALFVLVNEVVGLNLEAAEELGEDVMPEVVLGVGVFGILDELGDEDVGVEEIDAHGDIDHTVVEGRADAGLLGLFDEAGDFAGAFDLDDAEVGDLVGGDGEGGKGDVRSGVAVLLEHEGVVHLVDVVAGEDEDVLGLFRADGVDVLEDGVGGALVPGLGDALHGRKDLDELAEFRGDDGSPAFADVAIQREAFVLGEDVDVAQVRVDAVGQRDVDDAVLPGEGNGRFGAVARERKQPLACPASQQNA